MLYNIINLKIFWVPFRKLNSSHYRGSSTFLLFSPLNCNLRRAVISLPGLMFSADLRKQTAHCSQGHLTASSLVQVLLT